MRQRKPPPYSTWFIDHSVLTLLPKSTGHMHTNCHKLALYNIRSFANKALLGSELIIDHKLEYLCLPKMWQTLNDFLQLNLATLIGFIYLCKPHHSGLGHGFAMIYCKNIKVK